MAHPKNIQELLNFHGELEDLFRRHQESLLEGAYADAKVCFEDFKESLHLHIQEEDHILLPFFRSHKTLAGVDEAEIFSLDHKRIIEWLGRLETRLSRLKFPNPDTQKMIALLDDEAHFKWFLERHTLREKHAFYPEVDRMSKGKEKRGLLRLLTFFRRGRSV